MAQATFEEISASDFFYRNRDIAGFTNPSRAIFVAIRELVENSLDAAESQKIPPDIYVRLSFEAEATKDTQIYKLRVEDNGSGIPPRFIPSAFGQVLYGHKYKLKQARHLRFRRQNGSSLRTNHDSSGCFCYFKHWARKNLLFQADD